MLHRKCCVNSNKYLQIHGNILIKFLFQTTGEHTKAKSVLHPFMTTGVRKYHDTDYDARLIFKNWYLRGLHDGKIELTINLFSS
jgi:hypothetical protein